MTYSLRFTEKMVGAFTFAEADYERGYAGGAPAWGAGGDIVFRLTIGTDDVDSFVADPRHGAGAHGYVEADVLGGRMPVEAGLFNLFVDEGPSTRQMLYRLYFADSTGRPLTLCGFKHVAPGSLLKVWPETSTLYIRVLSGHVPVEDGGEAALDGLVGSGILRIRPADFAWQLTTFRSDGPSLRGRMGALDAFGGLFLSELWQVFDPLRPRRRARRGSGGS